jgi:hypothetical protein
MPVTVLPSGCGFEEHETPESLGHMEEKYTDRSNYLSNAILPAMILDGIDMTKLKRVARYERTSGSNMEKVAG